MCEYSLSSVDLLGVAEEAVIIDAARSILKQRFKGRKICSISKSDNAKAYLQLLLGSQEREFFHLTWLDSQHRVIEDEVLFKGSISSTQVAPREVVKSALKYNAAACILAHNHPSGVPIASDADKRLTERLVESLGLIDVRVLDHVIVGGGDSEPFSFMEHGLM